MGVPSILAYALCQASNTASEFRTPPIPETRVLQRLLQSDGTAGSPQTDEGPSLIAMGYQRVEETESTEVPQYQKAAGLWAERQDWPIG